jgi:signal peptidase I
LNETGRRGLGIPPWLWGGLLAAPLVLLLAPRVLTMVMGGGFYNTPAGSMEPNLPVNSAYLSLPLSDEEVPERGTIAVFEHPSQPGIDYVKRVIGLPGDRISLSGGIVSINGELVRREEVQPYEVIRDKRDVIGLGDLCTPDHVNGKSLCRLPQWRETLANGRSFTVLDTRKTAADNFPEVEVPQGQVFVLGDHRDNSLDSRFPQTGMIPIANLKQEPWRFYISLEDLEGSYRRFLRRIEDAE